MMSRIFYVTQGSLSICHPDAASGQQALEFSDDDAGLQAFDRYIAANPDTPSAMLLDVIEEEFALDTIPKLGARDRSALIERRAQKKFGRTPYRLSLFQGASSRRQNEFSVVHSAISNHELIDPWVQSILRHETPLSGIYSVPLMASELIHKLFPKSKQMMFIAPQQKTMLRQVFMKDGKLRSARLLQGPGIADETYAKFVVAETIRSRRYLERTRMLGGSDVLDTCVVADGETAAKIVLAARDEPLNKYQFIDPLAAARKLGCRSLGEGDQFEQVFIAAMGKQRPKNSYARRGENRYWIMQRARKAIIATAAIAAATCSIAAAATFSEVWILKSHILKIQSQTKYLAETFRRENQKFDPIKADSHQMQLAVDTGDYLLANRVPVPWVMNQLGAVLGNYSDVQIKELSWTAENNANAEPERRRRGDALEPVAAPVTSGVSVLLTAEIIPFDGNMRRAFARIDQLAAEIEAETNFSRASAEEYPFNASSDAAISGEIGSAKSSLSSRFRLRIDYEVADVTRSQEKLHETT